jgi:hypothetical protein
MDTGIAKSVFTGATAACGWDWIFEASKDRTRCQTKPRGPFFGFCSMPIDLLKKISDFR